MNISEARYNPLVVLLQFLQKECLPMSDDVIFFQRFFLRFFQQYFYEGFIG